MKNQATVRGIARVSLVFSFAMLLFVISLTAVKADTQVGGPIISDTTWTFANSPYIVVESIDVWEGVTLTIEPGVTVKFDSEKKLQVNGELIAQGAAGSLITFTSNQIDPAPDDWGNIEFTSTAITTTMDAEGNYVSGSILQYCVVEYGGYEESSAIVAHSHLIDHCTVRNNDSRGIHAPGTETAPSRITNNTVSNNDSYYIVGGGIYAQYCTISGNSVSNNNNSGGSGSGIYAQYCTISGNSVSNNSGGSGSGIYAESCTISGNSVSGNSSTSEYSGGGGIYAEDSTVSDNTVSGNSSTGFYGGGGIYAEDSTVSDNTVSGNSSTSEYSGGGGIYTNRSTVSGNTISGNSADKGGGIYAVRRSSTILTNTITTNNVSGVYAQGAGAYLSNSDFRYNTVVGNNGPEGSTVGGVEIVGISQVHYNNLYGNTPHDVTVEYSSDISGTHNYWGTVVNVDILDQVYDWYDDSNQGKFLYVPYLQEPSPDAPFPPPTGLTVDFQGNQAILSWNGLPSFTTGWGYKTYYDTDSALPPFAGTGLNEGNSPIDVGDQTTYTFTGLDPIQDYYFAVTAYDNMGRESWYTNVVWKQGGYWVYLPAVLKP